MAGFEEGSGGALCSPVARWDASPSGAGWCVRSRGAPRSSSGCAGSIGVAGSRAADVKRWFSRGEDELDRPL